ncbi:hypothetical protein J5N97_017670 [Dioscorea zingiberensis]|uniref:F-box domain-containing protein n=1 Tax=Dioscorea zingiberensis TaxID=325984 RepID=A0A9D5HGK9_9LILI|nr:hypothetical protein J5N97_017670 [Dioscorea zingiberensis]
MDSYLPPPSCSGGWRDWAKLPVDLLLMIFMKLGAFEVLFPAQWVCRDWKMATHERTLWRSIEMQVHNHVFKLVKMEKIAKRAIDRSAGQLEAFFGEYCGNDKLLRYIADRTTSLKKLRLISCYNVSEEGLIEMVNRFPLLEELEITSSSMVDEVIESIGQACSQLKSFAFNTPWCKFCIDPEYSDRVLNVEAFAVANTMHELHHLHLIGNQMTNVGLLAILNSCIHLKSLDIRSCFNVKLDDNLRAKLSRIREVRLPDESTNDYPSLTITKVDVWKVKIEYDSDPGEFDYDSNSDSDVPGGQFSSNPDLPVDDLVPSSSENNM